MQDLIKEIKEIVNPYELNYIPKTFPDSVGQSAVNSAHQGFEKCRELVTEKIEKRGEVKWK